MSGYEYAADRPIPIPGRPSGAPGRRRDSRRGTEAGARSASQTTVGSAEHGSDDR